MIEVWATTEWVGVIDADTGAEVPAATGVGVSEPGFGSIEIAFQPFSAIRSALFYGDIPIPFQSPFAVPSVIEVYPRSQEDVPTVVTLGEPFLLAELAFDDNPTENLGRFGGGVFETRLRIDGDPADPNNPIVEFAPTFRLLIEDTPDTSGNFETDGDFLRLDPETFFEARSDGGPYELLPYGLARRPVFASEDRDFMTEFMVPEGREDVLELWVTLEASSTAGQILAGDDSFPVPRGEATELLVLGNDTLPSGITPELSIETEPERGSATVQGDRIVYEPRSDELTGLDEFTGHDQFVYRIGDGQGGEATATVEVEVGPDYALVGPPMPHLVEDGEADIRSLAWAKGDVINIAQTVENLGADDEAPVNLRFEAYPGDRMNGTRALDPSGGISIGGPAAGVRELETGGQGLFSYSFVIDNQFFRFFPPGEYNIGAEILGLALPIDRTGETGPDPDPDSSFFTVRDLFAGNNETPAEDRVRVTVFEDSLFDITLDTFGADIAGTAGNDLFTADAPGDNTLNGMDGEDTAHLRMFDEEIEATVRFIGFATSSPDPALAVSNAFRVEVRDLATGRTDTLLGIERLSLEDGVYLFDLPGDDVPFTYRLYSAAFARTPDERGLTFWNAERNDGLGDRAMANAFIASPEFGEKFGESPTDEEFIAALFGNVLLREPDPGGEAFWLNAFSSGLLDRADMLLAFSESQENIDRNADNYDDGVWVV